MSNNQPNSQPYQDFIANVSNEYLNFINECREKAKGYSSEKLEKCQIHHVVPRHHYKSFGLDVETFDLPENRVPVTFEDHIKAHEIRFQEHIVFQLAIVDRLGVYGEFGDKVAFTRMKNMQAEGMRAMQQAGGQAVNRQFKQEGRLMHDPEWQREMGRRSMARADALQIRSEGGKVGNRKRHKNRTVRKDDRYLWLVDGQPFMCTFGFDNGGDLLKALHQARPTGLQRVSQLIRGSRKFLYGWSCQKINTETNIVDNPTTETVVDDV